MLQQQIVEAPILRLDSTAGVHVMILQVAGR